MGTDKGIFKNKLKVKIIIISILAALMVVFAVTFGYAQSLLNYNKIYKGVSIGNVDVGGLTQREAEDKITKSFKQNNSLVLKFNCENIKFEIPASSISFAFDASKVAKTAYKFGRTSKKFDNLKNIISAKRYGYSLNIPVSFDKDQLVLNISENISDKIKDTIPMTVEIGSDKLLVTNGVSGMGIDKDYVCKRVESSLGNLDDKNEIEVKIITIEEKNLSFDEFYKKYNREPKDAVYTKTDDGHKIEPEVVGITLDKEQTKNILKENENNTETYEIPAKIVNPKITSKELEDKYVNHIIASYTTYYGGSTANRCSNIALAASKINGYVINPGKRFSYNGVVGPRTAGAGFKMAHVYVGNKVTDGIGGGICQVSSTLYNAVVIADLKIVSRTNHSLPVGYTPLGRDATVSYGSIDFVFENNKNYPVSIKATTSGQSITVSIVGGEGMDYSVDFVTEHVKNIPYSTETKDDPTLEEGQTKTLSNGSNGYVVNSYRVYKKDGKEFKRTYEAKSIYSPVSAQVAVGSKKADSTKAEESPAPSQTPNVEKESEQEREVDVPATATEPSASDDDNDISNNDSVQGEKAESQNTDPLDIE